MDFHFIVLLLIIFVFPFLYFPVIILWSNRMKSPMPGTWHPRGQDSHRCQWYRRKHMHLQCTRSIKIAITCTALHCYWHVVLGHCHVAEPHPSCATRSVFGWWSICKLFSTLIFFFKKQRRASSLAITNMAGTGLVLISRRRICRNLPLLIFAEKCKTLATFDRSYLGVSLWNLLFDFLPRFLGYI